MAIYRYFSTNNLPVIIFAESRSGYFTHVIDSGESRRYDSSSGIMRAAACGISPSNIVRKWLGLTNASELKNGVIACSGSSAYNTYPESPLQTANKGSITIKDEHGSHYGTQNCVNEKCYYSPPSSAFSSYSGCVGVKHNESDAGWIFKGWKVYCDYGVGITIPSANYERRNLDGQYVWDIPTPTEDDLSNALIIYGINTDEQLTVEAIYEELPKWSVSFDLNGGTGNAPSVEIYQGGAITIPDYEPVRDGYAFLGWSTSQDATTAEYISGDTFTPSENITLYAVWKVSDDPVDPDDPDNPSDESTKGFIRRSSTSDYLIFSIATGNLVYN